MPAPAAGEFASLLEYLRYQHQAFDVTSYGLTDEQARCTPTASGFCIGGVIKHVTTMEYAWTQQVLAPPGLAQDPWSLEGMTVTWAHREEQFVMRDDDTLDGLLERLAAHDDVAARHPDQANREVRRNLRERRDPRVPLIR